MGSVLAILLLLPSWAFAARLDKRKDKARAARQACLIGDPVTGVALLAELFIDSGEPNYIYNQARCYEQNHRYEDAISRYREFLKVNRGLSEQDRANVEKEIADCQKLLPPPAPVVPTTPVPVPVPAPSPTPVASVPVVVSAKPATAAAPRTDGRGLRIAGVASGAVGLASIGMGIYFYTRASSLSDDLTKSDDPKASDYRAGKNAVTMQWVCYGVGAAALVTGSILYYLGWPEGESKRASVAPVIGPSMAGIAAQGVF